MLFQAPAHAVRAASGIAFVDAVRFYPAVQESPFLKIAHPDAVRRIQTAWEPGSSPRIHTRTAPVRAATDY